MSTCGSEGTGRDFVPEHPGFVMEILVSCISSGERRVLMLLRRLLRRLLVLYPHSQPAQRLQHVRFYPWLASSLTLRVAKPAIPLSLPYLAHGKARNPT